MGNGQSYKTPTRDDIDVLARTIYGEARDQSMKGQIAVAFSVLHRAAIAHARVLATGKNHPEFGDGSIRWACQTPMQFDCWNVGDPNYAKINSVGLDDAAFQGAMYAACGAVHGLLEDVLPLSTHYYNPKIVTTPPEWVTGRPAMNGKPAIPAAHLDATIDQHEFFSGVG